MSSPPRAAVGAPVDAPVVSPHKSSLHLGRLGRAARYSTAGLLATWRHEAAFRLEVLAGVPLLALAWVLASSRWQALALCAAVVFVWVVELLNSAIEALADSVSIDDHPLLGRAKDMGSGAVMLSVVFATVTWVVLLWP